jgi:hypothetical protein
MVENYRRLYKSGDKWYYDNGVQTLKDLGEIPNVLLDVHSLVQPKHIVFTKTTTNSTLTENYIYLFIVKDKVIESLVSDVPITEIAKIDPGLSSDVSFFEKFDEYTRGIKY